MPPPMRPRPAPPPRPGRAGSAASLVPLPGSSVRDPGEDRAPLARRDEEWLNALSRSADAASGVRDLRKPGPSFQAGWVALAALGVWLAPVEVAAQGLGPFWGEGARLDVGEEGTLRIAGWARAWLRVAELDPGSTVEGRARDVAVDVGLREGRLLALGRLVPELAIAIGVGVLDLDADGAAAVRPTDAWADVALVQDLLHLGAGLHRWAGLSRASTVGPLAPIGLEPLAIASPTRGAATDAFDARLGGFAHGRVAGLDWRVAASRAFAPPASTAAGPDAVFVADGGDVLVEAYARWADGAPPQDAGPWLPGAWLGAERVLAVGAGALFQPEATAWTVPDRGLERGDAWIVAGDVFVDVPLGAGAALTAYGLYLYEHLGPRALRLDAPLDRTDGGSAPGGPGLGTPFAGTGHHAGLELAWLAPGHPAGLRFQLWAKATLQLLDAVDGALVAAEAGLTTWAFEPHLRATLGYGLRPTLEDRGPGAPLGVDGVAHRGTLQIIAGF